MSITIKIALSQFFNRLSISLSQSQVICSTSPPAPLLPGEGSPAPFPIVGDLFYLTPAALLAGEGSPAPFPIVGDGILAHTQQATGDLDEFVGADRWTMSPWGGPSYGSACSGLAAAATAGWASEPAPQKHNQ